MRSLRSVSCLSLFLAAVLALAAQQTHHQVHQPATQPDKLKDEFAVASLKALRGIESELGTFDVSGGELTQPRATSDLIDNADANATTDDEQKLVALLHILYFKKLSINQDRDRMKLNFYGDAQTVAAAEAKIDDDPAIAAELKQFNSCSSILESGLRKRIFTVVPDECRTLLAGKSAAR
jgi:hypothetical protein